MPNLKKKIKKILTDFKSVRIFYMLAIKFTIIPSIAEIAIKRIALIFFFLIKSANKQKLGDFIIDFISIGVHWNLFLWSNL